MDRTGSPFHLIPPHARNRFQPDLLPFHLPPVPSPPRRTVRAWVPHRAPRLRGAAPACRFTGSIRPPAWWACRGSNRHRGVEEKGTRGCRGHPADPAAGLRRARSARPLEIRAGRVSAGIFNLLDEKYWHWADVPIRDIHSADTVGGPDRYTRPGRNFSISINYRF